MSSSAPVPPASPTLTVRSDDDLSQAYTDGQWEELGYGRGYAERGVEDVHRLGWSDKLSELGLTKKGLPRYDAQLVSSLRDVYATSENEREDGGPRAVYELGRAFASLAIADLENPMVSQREQALSDAREYLDRGMIIPGYSLFDQRTHLGERPWTDATAIRVWESAHGHDVRLKCLTEFGCQVIESQAMGIIAGLLDVIDAAK